MSGALQSFLGEVGFRAEEVRDMRDFARAAEALASAANVDVGVFVSLLSRATTEGFARSASGDVVVVRDGDGYVLAARAPAARAPATEALHDLGNALTAVAGWARIARAEGSASARGEKALGAIEEATQIALDLARPSAPPGPPAWQSVGAAVQQAVQLIEPLAAERRVALQTARGSEVRVPVGRSALVSGIANLVKNAVEASQAGDEVSVGVEARDTGDGQCEVEVHVRGGRASEPPQVGRSTKGAGRGHGLKVVQSLARSAGGDLRFAVASDKPVVALLTLAGRRHDPTLRSPVPPPRDGRSARDDERAPRGSGTRLAARARRETNAALRGVAPSVLVVDDEPSIRELVTTALEIAGIHAQGVEGPEALDPRERRTYAIALVDVRLGAKDGLTVARELVEAGWARRFALMTGAPMGHSPDDALAVIKKPFDIEEVVSLIHRWTRAARERKAR